MFVTVLGYVAGTLGFAFACNLIGLDWQLMLALIHDVTHGRFYFPIFDFRVATTV